MARTILKTIGTSLSPDYINLLKKESGIGTGATFGAIAILTCMQLLDDAARRKLLKKFPQLDGYETRKNSFRDIDMEQFRQTLLELVEETNIRFTKGDMNTLIHTRIQNLRKKIQEDKKTRSGPHLLENQKLMYLPEQKNISMIDKKLYEQQLKINENLNKQIQLLKGRQTRSGLYLSQCKNEKEDLKFTLKNALEKIEELEQKLNVVQNSKVQLELASYSEKLLKNKNAQEVKNKADNARPIIKRIKFSLTKDSMYAVYLLKKRGNEYYHARITSFAYKENGEFYLNDSGEKEYLSYIVDTHIYRDGEWVLNRRNETISISHLLNRAVDSNCVPLHLKGFQTLLNNIDKVKLPRYPAPSRRESPYATILFSYKKNFETYCEENGIQSNVVRYYIAKYLVYVKKLYKLKVDSKRITDLMNYIKKYEKKQRTD